VKQEFFDLQKMKDGFLLEQKCRGDSGETVKYYEGNIYREPSCDINSEGSRRYEEP